MTITGSQHPQEYVLLMCHGTIHDLSFDPIFDYEDITTATYPLLMSIEESGRDSCTDLRGLGIYDEIHKW